MTLDAGVLRVVARVGAEGFETSGTLWRSLPDDLVITEDVVFYMLDAGRLRGMFAAARSGAADDEILLALDAAALTEPPDDWTDNDD